MRDWLLFLVEQEQVHTRHELTSRAREALDFRNSRWLAELGFDQPEPDDRLIEQCLTEITRRGWLIETGRLQLNSEAKRHIRRLIRPRRRLSPVMS